MSLFYAVDNKLLMMGAQIDSLTFKNAVRKGAITDYNDVVGSEVWEDCVVFMENENILLYDGESDLKFRRPLDRVMFKAFEDLITIAWFDDEMEKIHYTLEIQVRLDFGKLKGL